MIQGKKTESISLAEIDNLLDSGFAVFQHYYLQVMGKNYNRPRDKVISPFRRSDGHFEREPSFSIFFNANKGKYFFKDSGIGKTGSHYQFVMDLFGCDFKGAVSLIKRDCLGMQGADRFPLFVPKSYTHGSAIITSTETRIVPTYQDFNDTDLKFFADAGITSPTLSKFRASRAAAFNLEKENKSVKVVGSDANPIYVFDFASGRRKIYRPFEGNKQFKWTSNLKADEDLFGYEALPKYSDVLFLIGGNRDGMSFDENIGYPVCALSSETANISDGIMSILRQIAPLIITLYDNDKAGLMKAEKFEMEYQFPSANHVYGMFKGTNPDGTANDYVDFHRNNPGQAPAFKRELNKLIEGYGRFKTL